MGDFASFAASHAWTLSSQPLYVCRLHKNIVQRAGLPSDRASDLLLERTFFPATLGALIEQRLPYVLDTSMSVIDHSQCESIILRGDSAGHDLLYVYCSKAMLLSSSRPDILLEEVRKRRATLSIDRFAVGQILCSGLVPMPASAFAEIHVLGIGDMLDCRKKANGWHLEHAVVFPYFAHLSKQDQEPNAKRLMDLLTDSVNGRLGSHDSAILMLSAGKDSVALAVALARLERKDVRCLTFVANTEMDEDGYAHRLCQQLGLVHERIEIPVQQKMDTDILTNYFRYAPFPCVDDCQIPYIYALHAAGPVDAVLDGSGNDVYMGHVPSYNDRRREKLRLRNHALARWLELVVPYSTRLDQLLRDPVDHCFLQGLLRQRELADILPTIDSKSDWKRPLLEAYEKLDVFDFRAFVRGRHYDQGSCALKAFMACLSAGSQCLLPWCDSDIVDFYFHLPESSRFDRDSYKNKVLLRNMLHAEIDYPDAELGKRYFQFDRVAFYMTNRKRVEDEILGCPLWERLAAETLLRQMYHRLPRNPRVGVALNAWFLLSGWLNHNRYLHG